MLSEIAFRKGMHTLHVAYNREPSEDIRDLYFQALRDLTDPSFLAAVASVVKTERFFPSPAVVLEHGKAAESEARSEVPALPPIDWRRDNASRGMDVFKRELRAHGIDVEELVEHHSWPRKPEPRHSVVVEREPGQEG